MISDDRASKSLVFLAETDQSCAEAKADMERKKFRADIAEETVFKHETGTVADRRASAKTNAAVIEASENYFLAIQAYNAVANKRNTEEKVLDVWRSVQANRRQG